MEWSERRGAQLGTGPAEVETGGITRRRFVRSGAGLLTAGALLGRRALGASRPIRIGYISPQTGSLAAFGEADSFVLDTMRKRFQAGIACGGTTRPVEILVRDCQSSSNRAAEVASSLIKRDRVDMMLASSTSDIVNPVANLCEINRVPCLSTDAPWQAYYSGRNGDPSKGFQWTFHFFFGVEVMSQIMCDSFSLQPTNKVVGMLLGNDNEGNLFADRVKGFPPIFEQRGFKVFDPGRFQMTATDYSAQISAFKKANAEVLFGNLPLPNFSTFWTQAKQQGYKPKIATIGRALLMPSAINSLGTLGRNISIGVWWTPTYPFKSGLTGQTAAQLCAEYEAVTKKQWTQALGFRHALFEVAVDVLKRTSNPDAPYTMVEAIWKTRYESIAGPIQWMGAPMSSMVTIPAKNICTTPVVSGQWVQGKKWPYDLVITDNRRYGAIPVDRKALPL